MTKEVDSLGKDKLPVKKAERRFRKKIACLKTLASVASAGKEIDFDKGAEEALCEFEALGAQDFLQELLVAQMLSVHELQQTTASLAHRSSVDKTKAYYTNSAIKLSNCFTQQAALLAKLQGHVSQKITIERVDVRDGAQAIVGNVTGGSAGLGEKK